MSAAISVSRNLAQHIVQQKTADFDPSKFDDRYESALIELINQKRAGATVKPHGKPRPGTNVVDLMTALRQSLTGGSSTPSPVKRKRTSKRATGQKEMLLPIGGKKATTSKKAISKSASKRKAG